MAFQYTDVSSVMLLDCWAIPCVMLLSHRFLRLRFSARHYAGALLCVAGIAVLVLVDWLQHGVATGAPNAALGDLCVLAGATLYGVSNVAQEYLVRQRPRKEYIGMLGFYGACLSAAQCALLERSALAAVEWRGVVLLYLGIFFVGQFLQYALTPTMMRLAGATFFNLSLLTSDTFSLVLSVMLFDRKVTAPYIASALLIMAGIVVYQLAPEPQRLAEPDDRPNSDAEQGLLVNAQPEVE